MNSCTTRDPGPRAFACLIVCALCVLFVIGIVLELLPWTRLVGLACLGGAVLGLAAITAWDRWEQKRRSRIVVPAPSWHVIDEEYRSQASGAPWLNNATSPFRRPYELTQDQRDLAAEHAREKRYSDGLGDPQ